MGRRLADLEKEEASAVARWEGAGNPAITSSKTGKTSCAIPGMQGFVGESRIVG